MAEERTYKSVLFEVLPAALAEERSVSGRIDVRGLFYAARRLYLAHKERPYGREARLAARKKEPEEILAYDYFNNQIIPAYEREVAEIDGLTREARSHLHEAHTPEAEDAGEIGTEFVGEFEAPDYFYDKILYIEKHGIAQGLIDLGLGRRYDMAIIASRGYATEADRRLLERFDKEGHQIFVLHDCDIDGYGILANLRAGNERMPDLTVEAIDLGMSLDAALAFDPPLIGEEATRQKAIPDTTAAQLTEGELLMFTGRQRNRKVWEYKRYELNEIPAEMREPFVERQLRANGVRPKVIAPESYLAESAGAMRDADIGLEVSLAVGEILDTDAIVEALLPRFRELYGVEDAAELREHIREAFIVCPHASWRGVLRRRIQEAGRSLREEIEAAVREEIISKLTE